MTRGAIERVFRVLVEAPSKGAQLLQSGSIQFYILFTVGFTLVMLLHFLNHTKS